MATAADHEDQDDKLPGVLPELSHRAVLCVGGRTASVPIYRRLVERCGASFMHHDGGEEDNVCRLDSTLAAADKRCLFVDNPSAASLQRALAQTP